MDEEYIQLIITNGNSILINDNRSNKNDFFMTKLDNECSNAEFLKETIKQQLGFKPKKIIMLKKILYSNIRTYFVDITSKDNIDNCKFNQIIFGDDKYSWVSLNKNEFSRDELFYMKEVYQKVTSSHYDLLCMDELEKIVFSNINNRYEENILMNKKTKREVAKIDSTISNKIKFTTILAAVVLGILYNYFFVGKSTGISYIIFSAIFIGVFIWSEKENVNLKNKSAVFLLILIFLLSLTFGIFSNSILKVLNCILIPLLIVGFTILIRYENIKWYDINFIQSILNRISNQTFFNILKPFVFCKVLFLRNNEEKDNSTKKAVLKGILISIPLLIIIVALLTSADMMFDYYIKNIGKSFQNINVGKFIWHLLVIIFVSLYCFGFIWSFKCSYKQPQNNYNINAHLETPTIITILLLINVIYVFFIVIQFSYLYGSGNNILPQEFTYSEYARKGFGELVIVSIINLAILILSTKLNKNGNSKSKKLTNTLLSLLVIFTFNMVYSAHFKLSLYEEAYGFTYLRIFVHVFLVLLVMLFAIALVGIWNNKIPKYRAALIAILVVYISLNYINVDALISEKNIERYYRTGDIDIEYMYSLSFDAVPKLKKFEAEIAKESGNDLYSEIEEYLKVKKSEMDVDSSWVEFNYSKYKAFEFLKNK